MDALVRLALWFAYRGQLLVWWIFRPARSSAHVAILRGDSVLVVRNSYRRGLGLPAGELKAGESPREGAVRELAEEVGIRLDPASLRYCGVARNRAEYKLDEAHVFEAAAPEALAHRADGREVVWSGFVARSDLDGERLSIPLKRWLHGRLEDAPLHGDGKGL